METSAFSLKIFVVAMHLLSGYIRHRLLITELKDPVIAHNPVMRTGGQYPDAGSSR
jgi:hypothetical protein